jgi:dienelactone hydrolase
MEKIDITLTSLHNSRKFKADANYVADHQKKPVIIFNHGFKGFKDWGPFNLVAEKFARAGFVFIKMNFSHNGVTLDQPNEFADLEAFAQNNFCKELDDTGILIDYLFSGNSSIPHEEMDLSRLYIMGHSRGGAHVILKAKEDDRIKAVVTWAAVNNLGNWHSKEQIEQWKKVGRIFIHNARTNQEMPMDFQLVENFIENRDRLQVPEAVKKLQIPMLSIHGTDDPTVPVEAVKQIGAWNPNVKVEIIEGAGHTFGGTHPFSGQELPADLERVIDLTIDFFRYSV